MADRDMTAGVLTEIAADVHQPIYLVKAEFDAGDFLATDADRDVTWGGDTYLRAAGFLAFDGLEETGQLLVNEISVTLSGVDTAAAMAKVLNDDFLDRRIRIWLAFMDADNAVISDPVLIFDGRMDAPTIQEDPDAGSSTVSVKGTPAWSDHGRRAGRHTNDEEQQFHFSGDLGFEYVSEVPKTITWGRA